MQYVYILIAVCLFASCERREDKRVYEPFLPTEKSITLSQAKKDVFQFARLIENKYGSYEFAQKHGFDVEKAKIDALAMCEKAYSERKEIDTSVFAHILSDCFFAINDNHFSLYLNTEPFSDTLYLCKQTFAYFSNIYVKKIDGMYKVVYSGNAKVEKGDTYTDSPLYLFSYPSVGENVYRVCCISDNSKLNEKAFWFNGKPKKCFVSRSIKNKSSSDEIEIREIAGETFSYISCSSFYFCDYDKGEPSEEESLVIKQFNNAIKNAFAKDTVIFDLRRNTGGYVSIAIDALNEVIDDFSGTLYILIGKDTASAAEIVPYKLKNYPYIRAFTVGEKTRGAITTGAPTPFCLKYSRIIVTIPLEHIEIPRGTFIEGLGIMPDYWAFQGDVVATLYALTGNEEVKILLSRIE